MDDAPWGFAPFHYGRWVDWNGGWGWAPGPLGYWNPYYAPALVGWIGGGGFGVGFGWGGGWGFGVGFGWFPLGWGAAVTILTIVAGDIAADTAIAADTDMAIAADTDMAADT